MGSASRLPAVPLIEPIAIADTFASGLARAEIHGNIVHFILFCEHSDSDGNLERTICARILMPKEAVPAAIRIAISAVSNDFLDRAMPAVFKFSG
jgi:hypothetical protein